MYTGDENETKLSKMVCYEEWVETIDTYTKRRKGLKEG